MSKITRLEIFQPRPRTPDVLSRPGTQRNQDAYDAGQSYGGGSSTAGGDTSSIPDPGGNTGGMLDTGGNLICIPTSRQIIDTVSGSFNSGDSIGDVYFDGLLADPSQYSITNDTIIPVGSLMAGTQITYSRFQPGITS